jgi:hypothetical protein
MKVVLSICISALIVVVPSINAFVTQGTQRLQSTTPLFSESTSLSIDRKDFVAKSLSVLAIGTVTVLVPQDNDVAYARGRATLEKTYERYAPRIQAGTKFYTNELKQMVAKDDWKGIKNALQEPPSREKGDLNKPDAGVSARAALAGGFSNARVLVAADLFGAAFSESSITPKTKKMQKYVAETRSIIEEMQSIARQALGEESSGGGLFGLGAKKPSTSELSKKMKELYTKGGNTWNQYIAAANDNLALQFDRFEYAK